MVTLNSKQKLALALSVPVVGILFYFVLKWSRQDQDFEDDANPAEDEFISSADLVSEIQIQQRHVGAVIGNVVQVLICRIRSLSPKNFN